MPEAPTEGSHFDPKQWVHPWLNAWKLSELYRIRAEQLERQAREDD